MLQSTPNHFDVTVDYLYAHVDIASQAPLAPGKVIRALQPHPSANSLEKVDVAASSVRVRNTWLGELR